MSTSSADGSAMGRSSVLDEKASHDSPAKSTLTKQKPHISIDNVRLNGREEQKTEPISRGHDTSLSAPTCAGPSDSALAGSTNHIHNHSSTICGHQGQCLTQQTLADLQDHLARFHADPSAVRAAQEMEHKHAVAAARSIGFELPKSLAANFKGMMPMERYKAEQKLAMGP